MEGGSIKEMSIGFFLKKFEIDTESEVRRLTEIELFEISLVTKAANPSALIDDFKSLDESQKNKVMNELCKTNKSIEGLGSLKDIEKVLKESGFSNNESKALISKIKEFSSQREVGENNEAQCDIESISSEVKTLNQILTIKNNIKKCQNL